MIVHLLELLGKLKAPARKVQPNRVRLGVEVLEQRAVPATLHVGSLPYEFHSIQLAVNAAHTNDQILVDPGVYTGQVIIGKSLTLQAADGDHDAGAIIEAPSVLSGGLGTGGDAIVEITNGAPDVEIQGFTIEGPGNAAMVGNLKYGILVDAAASADIEHNHITAIADGNFGASPFGVAIDVGNSAASADTGLGVTTGSADIENNTIDNYQRGGIVISNAGSVASIDNNRINGVAGAVIGQIGVEVSDLAVARISNNTISNNEGSGASAGIVLFNPGAIAHTDHDGDHHGDGGDDHGDGDQHGDGGDDQGDGDHQGDCGDQGDGDHHGDDGDGHGFLVTTVINNKLTNNDYGVFGSGVVLTASQQAVAAEIENNQISASTFVAIEFDNSNGVAIDNNQLFANGSDNTADGGIYLFQSTGNTITNNQSKNNNGSGIYIDAGSTGNTLENNQLSGNTLDLAAQNADAVDLTTGKGTSGTANIWANNQGHTFIDLSGTSLFQKKLPDCQ